MTKFTILLKRHPSMTPAQFVAYHREKHAPLFRALPAVRELRPDVVLLDLMLPGMNGLAVETPGLPPAKYDGITELWFDDAAGIAALFSDPGYLAQIRPDEERFLDLHGCDFVVSEEHVVL